MSDFKVKFTLKQHTPIIHFQSAAKGATLRATELKPKFDKFITTMLKGVDPSLYNEYKDIIEDQSIFPVEDKKGSNAYKITIQAKGINLIETPKAYVNKKKETDRTAYMAPYFADASKSIFMKQEVDVTIKSFNTSLLELLDKCKDFIFVYENFGTRQSKGFGSYLRSNIKESEIHNILSKHTNKVFMLGRYSDYKSAFETIDTFYKELKMGINKPYKKSLLFRYMCKEHNVGWEKKFIKNNFPEVIHGEHSPVVCEEPDDKEFKYIRSMLGLAEHNEFRPGSGKKYDSKQVKIESVERDENDSDKPKYQRFKSPITFKIFNGTIYVLFDDSYKALMDVEFKFTLKRNVKLYTPNAFDMYSFLTYVSKETNLQEVTL